MAGAIVSTGFASGDRVVVGHWRASPLGPIDDVMWATAAGERVLLAPDERVAAFVGAVYGFDRTDVVPFDVAEGPGTLDVTAGPLALTFAAGRGRPIPFRSRPAAFTRWVEGPIARAALGVRTYGTSPSGVREWYRADRHRPLVAATGRLDGVDLGAMAPVDPPVGVGFSEPPRRPSWVEVRPLLEDPSGRLDELLR